MTAFDYAHRARIQALSFDYSGAILSITLAIELIDKDGVDAHLRPELVALRNALIEVAQ